MASLGTAPLVAADPTTAVAASPTPKILFLGNSITKHSPKADIGWTGNWGMAASAADKDYVHLVTKGVADRTATVPQMLVQNIAVFERTYATYDLSANLKDAVKFQPTLIILAIGENVPVFKTGEDKALFTKQVINLLTSLKASSPAGRPAPVIIVRSSFWPHPAKDQCLREACEAVGGIFVDLAVPGRKEADYARAEREFQHNGVARHPGDHGMQLIADAILKAMPKL
jgi:alpha-galactosidase